MLETMDTRVKATVDGIIRPFDGEAGLITLFFEEDTMFRTGVELDEPFELNVDDEVMIELSAFGRDIAVYADESEYREKSGRNMAAESYIPCGLFRPDGQVADEDKSAHAYMNGVVRIAEEHHNESMGTFYALLVECLGVQFTAFVNPAELGGKLPEEGNIITGLFYIVGNIYQ